MVDFLLRKLRKPIMAIASALPYGNLVVGGGTSDGSFCSSRRANPTGWLTEKRWVWGWKSS